MNKKAFIFGVSVSGENFTDRVKESHRLKMNFENGQNVILLSPRRMGKTSLVQKVMQETNGDTIKVVYLDIYDCRNENEFYQKLAHAVLRATASRADQMIDFVKQFLSTLVTKVTFSPTPDSDFSFSFGLNLTDTNDPTEILNLPERIAEKTGKHIVICIDEFQQIGEMPDTQTIQKRLRGIWQLQQNVSYCLFGSKKHMLLRLFKDKRKPFYQFGDTIELGTIPTEDWVTFICRKFTERDIAISKAQAEAICTSVRNYSSYVQQMAWNVMLCCNKSVTDKDIEEALNETILQNTTLFQEQIKDLSAYQMNFLRAICSGIHSGFTAKDILDRFNLGAKSNVSRLHTSLVEKELIESLDQKLYITDPVFEVWFKRNCCPRLY